MTTEMIGKGAVPAATGAGASRGFAKIPAAPSP